jgi:hypothetical protein
LVNSGLLFTLHFEVDEKVTEISIYTTEFELRGANGHPGQLLPLGFCDTHSQELLTAEAKAPQLISKIELGTSSANTSPNTPTKPELLQNYPNPFNPSTEIEAYLPPGQGEVKIYNMLGQTVRTYKFEGASSVNRISIVWDGKDQSGRELASGMYFYRITAGKFEQVKKMMLLR